MKYFLPLLLAFAVTSSAQIVYRESGLSDPNVSLMPNGSLADEHGVVVVFGARGDLHLRPYLRMKTAEAYVYDRRRTSASELRSESVLDRIRSFKSPHLYTSAGKSVAIHGDTIVVGEPLAIGQATGVAVIFKQSNGTWSEDRILDPSLPGDFRFGRVAMNETHLFASVTTRSSSSSGRTGR